MCIRDRVNAVLNQKYRSMQEKHIAVIQMCIRDRPYSVPGYSDGKYFVGVSGYWSIHSKATEAQKAAAKDFINWMFTDSEAQKIVVNDCKFIPPVSYTHLCV